MASDGMIFAWFATVDPVTNIPKLATLASMVLSVLLVLVLNIDDLVGFTDISGFMVYSVVAMALLVMRYCDQPEANFGAYAAVVFH